MVTRVLIMAGGTGGHVFPALAVAEQLRDQGAEVLWMGTRNGLEAEVVPRAGFELAPVMISGLRGKGLLGWLLLPSRLSIAMMQSLAIIMRFRPMAVLGMGGFVAGPGGLMAWLLNKPLLIHEQNAVAGMTNRWLARIATHVLVAFPGAMPEQRHAMLTGNPVRREIARLAPPDQRFSERSGPLRVLVLGGSQGARALNETLPGVIADQPLALRPQIWHQTGRGRDEEVREAYAGRQIEARVEPFIGDMAAAYAWADVAICRSGALTVAELTTAGLGAILVPYPHAVDDHQTHNGTSLVEAGAGVMIQEGEGFARALMQALAGFCKTGGRDRMLEMAQAAHRLSQPDAASKIMRLCLEAADGQA